MQTSEDLLIKIRDQITAYQLNVKSDNKANRYNINDRAETFTIPLFKLIFGWGELRDLNIDQKNYPGIDLGDTKHRIAIQVTSETALEKIKKTLMLFVRNNQYINFDRIIIFMIREKQKTYSQSAINKICNGKFKFSVKKDIIDLNDLLKYIKDHRLHDLQTINQLFQDETGYITAETTESVKRYLDEGNKPDTDKKIQMAKKFLQYYYNENPTIIFDYESISKSEFISKANAFICEKVFISDSELTQYLYLASQSFIYG